MKMRFVPALVLYAWSACLAQQALPPITPEQQQMQQLQMEYQVAKSQADAATAKLAPLDEYKALQQASAQMQQLQQQAQALQAKIDATNRKPADKPLPVPKK